MSQKKCCVPGCEDKTSRRHAIPVDNKLQKVTDIWIERIGNPKLFGVNDKKFISSHRVCRWHFADMCIGPNNRLMAFSLPTLELPGYVGPSTKETSFYRPEIPPSPPVMIKKLQEAIRKITGQKTTLQPEDLKVQVPLRMYPSTNTGLKKISLFPPSETETVLDSVDNSDDSSQDPTVFEITDSEEMKNVSTVDISEKTEHGTPVTKQTFRPLIEVLFTTSKAKKRRTSNSQDDFKNVCAEAISRSDKVDEFDAVGFNVSAKLRKMDPYQASLAEVLINKIIFKGTLQQLTLQTKVIEVPRNDVYLQHSQIGQSSLPCTSSSET